MYRSYCNTSCYPPNRDGGLYSSDSSSILRYNFGNFNPNPSWNENRYGRRRRRPFFWQRDLDLYNRIWRNRRRRNRRGRSRSNSPEPKPEPKPEPEPEPKPEPPKEEEVKVLKVEDVDLNIKENTEKNKTDDFDCVEERDVDGIQKPAELVVRRGNFMKLTFKFNRPYDKKKYDLKLCFTIGKQPRESKGTMAQFEIDEDGKKEYKPDEWGGYLESQSGNNINVMVHMAANSIVGEWNLTVKTFIENGKKEKKVFEYGHDDDITILFNPWCKDDGVYMETTGELEEYVNNQNGCAYRGNAWSISAKPWNFGQFEEGVLDACLYLLRCGFKDGVAKEMADPIKASRIIAKMVNSSDDNGVLCGNWSGDYSGGTSPSAWLGSPRILNQFMKSGPVKYGQCWVFSCLTTTVCRCLGIPCRTVTNFASAHDADETNCIEEVFVERGGKLHKLRSSDHKDSVWNFHVWNEAWMARPDIELKGMNGWQVIDATPQEKSDGFYTCGPCPVAAVKNGEVNLDYDTGFVFAEVNADVVHFKCNADGTYERMEIEKTRIGKMISTKIPDGKPFIDETFEDGDRCDYDERKRLDLTSEYKFPEGSVEERRVVENAVKKARGYKQKLDPYKEVVLVEKVSFKIDHSNKVWIGSDLKIDVIVKNEGARTREVLYVSLGVSPKAYTGETGPAFFERYYDTITLEGRQETKFEAIVTAEEYMSKLVEQANLYIEVTGVVTPLQGYSYQETVKSHDFRFIRPDLFVRGPKKAEVGTPVQFEVTFKNPVPRVLTNCTMSMGSSGFKDIEDEKQPDVAVGETYFGKFTMVPKKKKRHEVVFTFECDELRDISGSTCILIEKK